MAIVSPNVPIVGQLASVYEATVVVSVRCNCQPDNAPFLISTIDQAKVCKRCGRAWALMATAFDRRKGPRIDVTVGLVGQAADKPSDS